MKDCAIDKHENFDNALAMKKLIDDRLRIVKVYELLLERLIDEASFDERISIRSPYLGTVQDGSVAYRSDECRKLIILVLSEYYSTENLDKWNDFKEMLQLRIENNELNYKADGNHIVEILNRNMVAKSVIEFMEYLERENEVKNGKSCELLDVSYNQGCIDTIDRLLIGLKKLKDFGEETYNIDNEIEYLEIAKKEILRK